MLSAAMAWNTREAPNMLLILALRVASTMPGDGDVNGLNLNIVELYMNVLTKKRYATCVHILGLIQLFTYV